jgi:hypothetical protein
MRSSYQEGIPRFEKIEAVRPNDGSRLVLPLNLSTCFDIFLTFFFGSNDFQALPFEPLATIDCPFTATLINGRCRQEQGENEHDG